MGIVDARGDQPPAEALKEAAEALRVGLAVALPTDTVYGLAADVSVPGATDRGALHAHAGQHVRHRQIVGVTHLQVRRLRIEAV